MNVNGLTNEQRQRMKANLVRQRDGLDALIKRMQAVGWHTDDAMFQTILAARHAIHAAVNSITPAKQSAPVRDRLAGRGMQYKSNIRHARPRKADA